MLERTSKKVQKHWRNESDVESYINFFFLIVCTVNVLATTCLKYAECAQLNEPGQTNSVIYIQVETDLEKNLPKNYENSWEESDWPKNKRAFWL